ncbi:MAG: GtrA family protein [Pannonibacter sp.]
MTTPPHASSTDRTQRSGMREQIRQLFAFGVTGLLNTGIGLGVIVALGTLLHFDPWLANLGGYAVGLCVSFVLNRYWTFGKQALGMPVLSFLVAFAVSYLVNLAVLMVVVRWWPSYHLLGQVVALGSYSVVFFLICRFLVFRTPQAGD